MSKQHRTRKASSQKPRRRPRAAGASSERTAAIAESVDRRLDRLAGAFDRWGVSDIESVTFADVAEPLAFAFRSLAFSTGHSDVTSWDPDELTFLFDVVVPQVGLEPDTERMLAAAMYQLTAFLRDTGRWTGSPQALSVSLLLLQEIAGIDDLGGEQMREELTAAATTQVDPVVELGALRSLPVLQHLEALLSWLGPGRAVTATGALRLADLPAAAALVGVPVRTTARSPEPAQLALEGVAPGPSTVGSEASLVASMWDVTELASVWVTAAETGLIEIGSTRVRPTQRSADLRQADDGTRVELARHACARHLDAWLERVLTESILGPGVVAPVVSAFFGALTGEPLRAAQVAQVVVGAFVKTGEPPDRVVLDLALELAGSRLEQVVEAGFLRLEPDGAGTAYRVPDALVPAVAQAMLRFVGDDRPLDPS